MVCECMAYDKMVGRVVVVLRLVCLQLGISLIILFMKVINMEICFILNSSY